MGTSELGGGDQTCGDTLFNNRFINSTHEGVSHFLVEWLLEILARVPFDSKILLDPANRLNTFDA